VTVEGLSGSVVAHRRARIRVRGSFLHVTLCTAIGGRATDSERVARLVTERIRGSSGSSQGSAVSSRGPRWWTRGVGAFLAPGGVPVDQDSIGTSARVALTPKIGPLLGQPVRAPLRAHAAPAHPRERSLSPQGRNRVTSLLRAGHLGSAVSRPRVSPSIGVHGASDPSRCIVGPMATSDVGGEPAPVLTVEQRYVQMCTDIRFTDEISLKLLGLISLVSGAGILTVLFAGPDRSRLS
jgi:hypothetical protein